MTEALNKAALLRAAHMQDLDWLDRQPSEAKKEFSAWLLQRRMASIPNGDLSAIWMMLINERANRVLVAAEKHDPSLAFRILAACGLGENQQSVWIAPPKRSVSDGGDASRNFLQRIYPLANNLEIDLLLDQYDPAEFGDLVRTSGMLADEITETIAGYERATGKKVPADEIAPEGGRSKAARSRKR